MYETPKPATVIYGIKLVEVETKIRFVNIEYN
jgi:hypothetical protein